MATGTLIYEGKAKKIFTTGHPDEVLQYFKDDATAFNAQKRGTIVEKGIINNKVSERLFRLLEQSGVPTHFVERKSDREMLTKKVAIVPVEVVVRNVVAGSLAKRLGLKEGEAILPPIVEWYYKNDALGDPLIADDHGADQHHCEARVRCRGGPDQGHEQSGRNDRRLQRPILFAASL